MRLLLLLLVACRPTFVIPSAAVVACDEGTPCPAGYACAVALKECRPLSQWDAEPPLIELVAADTASSVTLVFNEPVSDVGSVSINDLVVTAASFLLDRRTLRITTQPQTATLPYSLTVNGEVYDDWHNALAQRSATFVGFGIADTAAPELIAPEDGTRVLPAEPIVLGWSARAGCPRYVLEISARADFADLVEQHVVEGTSFDASQLQRSPLDLYWRVRSPLSPPSAARRISLEDPAAVYVNGSNAAAFESGNAVSPFHNIPTAIAYADLSASRFSPPKVRPVRIASGDYVTGVQLRPETVLEGVPSARLIAPPGTLSTVLALNAHNAALHHLSVRNDNPGGVAVSILGTDNFALSDCALLQGGGGDQPTAVRIFQSNDVSIARSTIVGTSEVASHPCGLFVQISDRVSVDECSIDPGAPATTGSNEVVTIDLVDSSDFTLTRSTVRTGNALDAHGLKVSGGDGRADGNVFDSRGRSSPFPRGIFLIGNAPAVARKAFRITNNLFYVAGTSFGRGVEAPGPSAPGCVPADASDLLSRKIYIANNTFSVGLVSSTTHGIEVLADCRVVTNNLFYSKGLGSVVYANSCSADLSTCPTNVAKTASTFVNAPSGDLHLAAAVTGATNLTGDVRYLINADKDGVPRPATGSWSPGAYQ